MASSKVDFAIAIMNSASDMAYKAAQVANLYDVYFDNGYNEGGADELTDADIAGQNITAARIAAYITFAENLALLLDNGVPAQGDYSGTINRARGGV